MKSCYPGRLYNPVQEISMHFKQIFDLFKNSVTAWVDDYAPSMGAAI